MSFFKKKSDKELNVEIAKFELIDKQRKKEELQGKERISKINKLNKLRLNNTRTGKLVNGLQKFAVKVDGYAKDFDKKPKRSRKKKPLIGDFGFKNPFE